MKNWRPNDWPKTRTKWSDENLGKPPTPTQCYEAGASKMLKANRPLFSSCLRILLVYKFPESEAIQPLVKQLQERIKE